MILRLSCIKLSAASSIPSLHGECPVRFPVLNVPTILAGLLGPLACLGSAVATGTTQTDATATGIQAEIDALRAEIDAMRSDAGGWTDDARREEIRGIVSDVLADADGRVAFQDDSAIVGWKKGFRLQSPDGNFLLKIGGQMQIRWTLNHANGYTGGNENLWGFENRRTKLVFEGNVVDPSWTYRVKGVFSRAGGVGLLEEAWGAKKLDNGVKIKVGRSAPSHERKALLYLLAERPDLRLRLDGNRVNANQTPADLDMEDGDVIDVMVEQQGGAQGE